MKKIAIMASGNGSNAENIIHHFYHNHKIKIALVLTNKADAYVIQRAKNHHIRCYVFTAKQLNETDLVIEKLKDMKIDFIVLAGFLLKIPENILRLYPNKIVNIHPALLPKYGGKGMYGMHVHEKVIQEKETVSGITIHLVNENYDEGEIVFRAKCSVNPDDTPETLAQKVHELEYNYYPLAIERLVSNIKSDKSLEL